MKQTFVASTLLFAGSLAGLTLSPRSASAADAGPVNFSIGRLQREPAAALKTDTTQTLTGLTCAWTCTNSATQAAEFGLAAQGHPGLVAYTGSIANCAAPNKAVIAHFTTCCRPAPYSDWGVVANGVINGAKVRAVLPCPPPTPTTTR